MGLTNQTTTQTSDADALRDQGNEHFTAKRYAEAETCYKAALSGTQSDAKLYSNLSVCCLYLSRAEDALSHARSCIELDPTWFKGHFRLANAHKALKQDELALINAVKCAFYDTSFRNELISPSSSSSSPFHFANFTCASFTVINNQADMANWQNKAKHVPTCHVLVIDNCQVQFLYQMRTACLVVVGMGRQALVRASSIFGMGMILSESSSCILSDLRFATENGVHSIGVEDSSRLFINECDFSNRGPVSMSCICASTNSSLSMWRTRILGTNEAGVMVMNNSTLSMHECEVHNAGDDQMGAGVSIATGSEANITACIVDNCHMGIVAFNQPGNVTIADSTVSNSRVDGVRIAYAPSHRYRSEEEHDFVKPVEHTCRLTGNTILSNRMFGVVTHEQANVEMSRNQIAFNGNSGVTIRNNTSNKLTHNVIHSNKKHGVEIHHNPTASVLVSNNVIKNNKCEQISDLTETATSDTNKVGLSKRD